MSESLVLFLPAETAPWRWLRVRDGTVAGRGEGWPEGAGPDDHVVAVAPASAVALHWASLPAASRAQATTAARMLAAEASVTAPETLHVAIAEHAEADAAALRAIAVVDAGQMRGWLATLAQGGVDPAAMVPAALLPPAPEVGLVRADLGGERVLRGPNSAFVDEPGLTELIAGDAPIADMEASALEAAIVATVAAPPLDLRQGPFARKRNLSVDWLKLRGLGVLAGVFLALLLLGSLVTIMRYSFAADALDREADIAARAALPRGAPVTNAARQLETRLAALRGPGAGFSATTAALVSAVQAVPGCQLSTVAFDANGDLRAMVEADNEATVQAMRQRIEAQGFSVVPSTFENAAGRLRGQLTISGR